MLKNRYNIIKVKINYFGVILVKKAELEARKFFQNNNLSCPINLAQIAKIIDGVILEGEFEEEGAICIITDSKTYICVDKNQEEGQKRFNVAHEAGHKILKHEGRIFASSGNIKPFYEKQADVFASELLIPRIELKKNAPRFNFDVQKLKEYFVVSEKAMVVKMKICNLPINNTIY